MRNCSLRRRQLGISHHPHLMTIRDSSILTELLDQHRLQSVKRDVRDRWRGDTSLWSACLRWKELPRFHISSFQPAPENILVHRNMGFQPFVLKIVEATENIAL